MSLASPVAAGGVRIKTVAAILAVLLMVTSAMLVKFRVDNHELRMEAASIGVRPPPPTYVPALSLATLDGNAIKLASGRRQTFLVFSTTCGFCRETMPVWRTLLKSLPTDGRVVALSLDSENDTRTYLDEEPLPIPIVALGEKERSLFGLGPVPHMMTVDEQGRIVYARTGSLAGVDSAVLDSIRMAVNGS